MDLLTAQDVAAVREALENVMDTFLTLPITYKKASTLPDAWGENKAQQFTNYNLFALYVESDNQTSTVDRTSTGAYDVVDGYFLLSFLRLQEAGLVVNGLPDMNPATDFVEANGKTYQFEGVPVIGQFKGRFECVKIIVKKYPNRV